MKDDFKLLHNESTFSPGDYYHTFTLKISPGDKERLLFEVKGAKDFMPFNGSDQELYYLQLNQYHGPKVIRNYETPDAYVREYFQPSGKEGYVATFRRITIPKIGNELVFEDIDN